ncbi:hypothetical protein [Bacillus bingmayongensis]|uniref:hypothetical protein n=1 Tax=Bacillus bingmayongensis TaxID=1150157 RepID=UPI00030555C7|nr:hypothetical protein [Bacillus bingmayongensis]
MFYQSAEIIGINDPIGDRERAIYKRKTINGVQIEVITIGDEIVSGYPTSVGATLLLNGFTTSML